MNTKKILKFIHDHGGYWFGHLPHIRQAIVKLEDIINKRGLPISEFRRSFVKAIHLATGNTVYYLDYANGNDAWAGDSFAAGHPWKTINGGATAARIAPGDVIRIAKSPAPTSIGNADWTNLSKTVTVAANLTKPVDSCETLYNQVAGLITVLNVTPTAGGSGYAVNDTFNITTGGTKATGKVTTVSGSVVTGVSLLNGGSGYSTGASKATTKISGGGNNALTVNITSVWTAIPQRVTSQFREGSYAGQFGGYSGMKAGSKVGYLAITPGTLAAYQKLSFWMLAQNTVAAGNFRIVLCSDAAGETIVDEFLVPALPYSIQNNWMPVTVTKTGGGNMGASIASIAIYTDTLDLTNGVSLFLDNIIACTTAGLNLQSLISKNAAERGGTEGWWAIQSIVGTTVLLDGDPYCKANQGRGYSGATEAAKATYIRETIHTPSPNGQTTTVQEVMDSGTVGSNIEFQGGYDTGSGNPTGETFFDGLTGYGVGLYINGKSYTTLNYLNFVRYVYGIYYNAATYNLIDVVSNLNNNSSYGLVFAAASSYNVVNTLSNANCNSALGVDVAGASNNNLITLITNANSTTNNYGVYCTASAGNKIGTIVNANNNFIYGIYLSYSASNSIITTISNANNNGNSGIYIGGLNVTIDLISNANNNTNYGVFFTSAAYNLIKSLSTSGNGVAGIGNDYGLNVVKNWVVAEGTHVAGFVSFEDSRLFSQKHNSTAYSKIFTDGGTIESQASTLTHGSGIEWKFTTVTNTNRQSTYPLRLVIARIAVTANNQVTVKAWFKKGDASAIAAQLVCKVDQIAWSNGTSDVVTACPSDTNENEVQIQFTPTEAGVVEIEAQVYYVSGHSTVIVDAMTITQA